jgi:hypothetical protein
MGLEGEAHTGAEHCLCQSRVSVEEHASSLEFRLILNHQYVIHEQEKLQSSIDNRFMPDCEVVRISMSSESLRTVPF